MPENFSRDPVSWIQDREHARQLLSAYLTPGLFTGSLWDPAIARRIGPAERNTIDVEDLYSPTLLSAAIRGSAGQAIIERADTIAGLLRAVDHDVTLWSADEAKVHEALGAADRLITELQTVSHVGPTRASKLVAAKRPHLVPIWDKQISQAIGAGRMSWQQYWAAWRRAVSPAIDEIRSLAREVGHPNLPPLRTVDIIIWMDEWGWNDLPAGRYSELRAACQARHARSE